MVHGEISGPEQTGVGRDRISFADRLLASCCGWCPLCRRARRRGKGIAFNIVRRVEAHACPFCRAYERVSGRPAHESGAPL